ncbi:unnamed protein product [Diamesa hyperborea]
MVSTTSAADALIFSNATVDSCAVKFEDYIFPIQTAYCNWTFDSILCWPPTKAGEIALQRCPAAKGIDTSKYAQRRCSDEGKWEGRDGIAHANNNNGWTNYTPCYVPEVVQLFRKLYSGGGDEVKNKFDIADRTRILEIVGLCLSLIALIVSLLIFFRFRSLRNNRTRIHKNLFVAIVIQVLIRLTLYIDQAVLRSGGQDANESSRHGIDNTPYLCEGSYILLEYAKTAMCMWMFIEGLYLHNVVTVTVFQGKFPLTFYAILGWGTPIVMTAVWAGFTATSQLNQKCWWGYNLTPYYWILEGPRFSVLFVNMIFLLNIIKVLVLKLRQSRTSEIEQVRKAVRAGVVLIPLLGLTNCLNMSEAPLHRSALIFAIWSYTTHFLISFQGLFISLLYCFYNGEVRTALTKWISVYLSLRGHHDWAMRRQSVFSGNFATNADTEAPQNVNEENRNRQTTTGKNRNNWINLCFFMPKQINHLPQEQPESVVFDLSD